MESSVAFARATGTGHQISATPCQDSVFGVCGTESAAIVLADGAGSQPSSDQVSQAVTAGLSQQLAGHFDEWFALPDEQLREEVVNFCREQAAAAAPNIPPSCTLLFAAAAPDGRRMIGHLGDGLILGCSIKATLLSLPENGEERNLTYFLSSNSAAQHLRLNREISPELDTFLLCSDGICYSLLDETQGTLAPAATLICHWMQDHSASQICEALKREMEELFRLRTEDDMSIGILHCGTSKQSPFGPVE